MLGGSEILSPSESMEIADFVQFYVLGESEILSPSESKKMVNFVLF